MTQVTVKQVFDIPPDDIWRIIGQFNSLADWNPMFEKSEIEEGGTRRRLTLVGGGEILEQLEAHDDEGRTYTYAILESPLPIRAHKATIRVTEKEGGGSEVEWTTEFEPLGPADELQKTVQGVFQSGFDNLRRMLGG